ncbi:SDR family NAD(P)-dependent oxidoreductase [Cryptosporangium phraense]|uniref:SDR family NAD(P)-dependent oxidoreductase n=1 Tax=Cryptosporangium phraense TaxID=2593070 RepID=A0A545AT77_9ACTN|nr:SDR family NAD(P)-dependent oxidoreductase [Cryptosporangium phraense]TQS44523.1 SDR family NAD(P)-dependent oxidoreductase [Cryptosporangium phraense]
MKTMLILGASRGLGLGLAAEYLARGWNVIGTIREGSPGGLPSLADDRLRIETLDITDAGQLAALRTRLAGVVVDLLFVNAAITNGNVPAAEVPTEEFVDVMVTNVLSPMRAVEALAELVPPTGTIAVMSSRQGSITMNTNAGYEVYRASKSALNQLMKSYAVRHASDPRTLLLVNPGHVQTELGGPGAVRTVEEAVPPIVDTIEKRSGEPGLQFVDYENQVVPW